MKKTIVIMLSLALSVAAFAQNKSVVDIAVGSKSHTILVTALKSAELVTTLQGKGPFTIFAPTNDAFEKLPKGTVETLLKADHKAALTAILTYHVVAGRFSSKDVIAAINKTNGKFEVVTLQGGKITLSLENGKVKLTDEKGSTAFVTTADLNADNGVIHVIDSVVMPK